jgi:hypothetical protein
MTLWEWSDKLKLGKSSGFVKKNLRPLPLTDTEFEADFFFDNRLSEKDWEVWIGIVVEREYGDVLALADVQFRPPTVNDLAALLANAMLRPLTEGNRQRPSIVHLHHRPQWQEMLPHLRQLGIRVGLAEELPIFDLAAAGWMYKTRRTTRLDEVLIEWMVNRKTATEVPMLDELRMTLRKPFPERRRSVHFRSMDLMNWSHEMCAGAYPSSKVPVPHYAPETIVPIRLKADALEAILTKTVIATSEELRPRLETLAAEDAAIDLNINEWGCILLALSGLKIDDESGREHLVNIGMDIAVHLAETLGIGFPADNE